MTKYQVGDKVIVRSDISLDAFYSMEDNLFSDIIVEEMVALAGKTVTIGEIYKPYCDEFCYKILEDAGDWNWTDEMFE